MWLHLGRAVGEIPGGTSRTRARQAPSSRDRESTAAEMMTVVRGLLLQLDRTPIPKPSQRPSEKRARRDSTDSPGSRNADAASCQRHRQPGIVQSCHVQREWLPVSWSIESQESNVRGTETIASKSGQTGPGPTLTRRASEGRWPRTVADAQPVPSLAARRVGMGTAFGDRITFLIISKR